MLVLIIARSVERNVRLGVAAPNAGLFQMICSAFKLVNPANPEILSKTTYSLFNDSANIFKLKRSSTPDRTDIAESVSGARNNLNKAPAIACPVTSSRITPLKPSRTTSPQYRDATTGNFHDCASSCVKPKPSESVGKIKTSASL